MTQLDDERLEEKLGIRFKNRALLELALTHSSAVPDLRAGHGEKTDAAPAIGNNERLEFLGDAVLDLLASEYLLENNRSLPRPCTRIVYLTFAAKPLSVMGCPLSWPQGSNVKYQPCETVRPERMG